MIRVLIMDNFIYSISKKRKRTLSHIETGKRLDDENTAFEKGKNSSFHENLQHRKNARKARTFSLTRARSKSLRKKRKQIGTDYWNYADILRTNFDIFLEKFPIPNCRVSIWKGSVNPLTPRSDQHKTSPHNILALSGKQPMRIFKLIRYKLLF